MNPSPERTAKPPRAVAGQVEAERERAGDLDGSVLLAAMAQDRARRRRHEQVAHVVLIALFLVIALPVLGVWVAKLLMPLALAR